MEAFVIGSGPSLLRLTREEKRFLAGHPHTLAMNQFLLHWEKAGFLPKDLFLTDKNIEGDIIVAETIRRARRLIPEAKYYIHKNYVWQYYGKTLRNKAGGVKRRVRLYLRHRLWMPFRSVDMVGVKIVFVKSRGDRGLPWAKGLEEPLCHYRGSLTAAVNLASLIYPVDRIKLVGVDLNVYEAFYGRAFEALARKYRLPRTLAQQDGYHEEARKTDRHATAVDFENRPGILSAMPAVRRHLAAAGVELVCCNRESLLVTEGACPYASILPEGR